MHADEQGPEGRQPPDGSQPPGSQGPPGAEGSPNDGRSYGPPWGRAPWSRGYGRPHPWRSPPWTPPMRWGPPSAEEWQQWQTQHSRRQRRLFLRFAGSFGLLALVVLGGLALLIYFVVRLAGGDRHTAALLWLGTCGLLLGFPLLAAILGRRAFRGITAPLSNLMDAAERVAAGDLSVRVPPAGRGEFGQMSAAFNHMVEELALADQRRRNLTADVAHELRTPLQIIQGNLEGVLDGVYQPTPEHLEATLGETRLLARLVEDLRVLSQAEAGQLSMHWEAVDVGELLADVATSFSGQAQAAGVRLRVTVGGQPLPPEEGIAAPALPPLTVTADYSRLEQVLGNLLANALRHTPAGGVVTLAAESSGDRVGLTVSDTGEGIPAADLPFIFDRFWRGDRARTHADGAGSGLGLAIARQLVQAHGGTITVTSAQGQGTMFTIVLKRE